MKKKKNQVIRRRGRVSTGSLGDVKLVVLLRGRFISRMATRCRGDARLPPLRAYLYTPRMEESRSEGRPPHNVGEVKEAG